MVQKNTWALFLLVFLFWAQQVSAVQVPGGPVKDSKGLAVQSTGRPKKSYEEVHGKVQSGFLLDDEKLNMLLVKDRSVDMFVCNAQIF